MALIAVAADKGSPGVTTSSVALAAVWPRPVLLAECDPAGGDLVYRLPAADGGQLDPRRGLLSLAVAARRGVAPQQLWEHAQKLSGGLDVLAGVTTAEQGAGLEGLWGSVGAVLSAQPQADVIADCGRIGADGPFYDLLAQAAMVVLITRAGLGDVVRLRDRVRAVTAGLSRRGVHGVRIGVVVIAEQKTFREAVGEVARVLADNSRSAAVLGGIAFEPRSASQLCGEWGAKLDRSLLIRTARHIAGELAPQAEHAARAAGGTDVFAPAQAQAPRRPDAVRPLTGQDATSAAAMAAAPSIRAAGQDDWPTILNGNVVDASPGAGVSPSPAAAAQADDVIGRAPRHAPGGRHADPGAVLNGSTESAASRHAAPRDR